MKLVSLNVGIKIGNTKAVVDFLLKQDADIVCLQEVTVHKETTAKEMFQVKKAIDDVLATKYPFRDFASLWQAKGFTTLNFGGFIEQGNYILSKFPILKSSNDFFHKKYEKIDDWRTVNFRVEDHGRALQTVELDCKGKPLRVMNLHGIWTADKRGDSRTISEVKFILEKARQKKLPTIIAGDFNLLPDTESIKLINDEYKNLLRENGYRTTRPSFRDNLDAGDNAVDYIFVGEEVCVIDFNVLDEEISDHLPLVLKFETL